ncbi:Glycyl-glycine endopeptidase ALE-1 precursor [Glaesserella parasuis]|uniref:murein DD-endopeptidase MepM n=1 Tax=Glaesserella parasuis TaxID=738 RepID=UPI000402CCEC|nr:peptidase M23 [Glaesserella parasuis D74]KEZ22082.1 Glycyl-glycine endopeptidase ALE-1 precursor [Glaesserella parasuis]
MQHVIFARDRRRKKNRTKAFVFLVIILSIFIGIALTLKRPSSNSSEAQEIPITLATQSLPEANQEGKKVTASTPTEQAVETTPEVSTGLSHGEPKYISIDFTASAKEEQEQVNAEPVDENATSYEDELSDVDDEVEGQSAVVPESEKLSEEAESVLEDLLDIADQALRIQNQFSYIVTQGDQLKDVLEQSGLTHATAKALEKTFPQLAELKVGQQFYWILDNNGELEYMNWLISEKEEKIFERKAQDQFAVQTIQKKGVWQQDVIKGTIDGSFSASLKAVGLSQRQINQLANGLQWQIATNKLKKGDKFAILVKREYINGKVTDLGNVEAIHIISGKKSYYAIQADNGRYYSRHGETLGKGFARYPLPFTPRVSSHFNPRRLHPVTRRVAPHKGVDFAVRSGTPIIAPADGVVEHIAYQANGAGRYIKVRHGGQYTTVYMHLSRSLVKVGQSVKKGQRIALSGNTGRSTGAHLHYEFHINGRPVNPMTVKLPGIGSGMPDKERKAFLVKARNIETKLKL